MVSQQVNRTMLSDATRVALCFQPYYQYLYIYMCVCVCVCVAFSSCEGNSMEFVIMGLSQAVITDT